MTDRLENILGAFANNIADAVNAAAHEDVHISGPSAEGLALINHQPGITIKTLRYGLNLSHAGTVRLIDRLSEAGLVRRDISLQDKRSVALQLTQSGQAACDKLLESRQSVVRDLISSLTKKEQSVLETIVSKVLQNTVTQVPHAYAVCRLCDADLCQDCPVEDGLKLHA